MKECKEKVTLSQIYRLASAAELFSRLTLTKQKSDKMLHGHSDCRRLQTIRDDLVPWKWHRLGF